MIDAGWKLAFTRGSFAPLLGCVLLTFATLGCQSAPHAKLGPVVEPEILAERLGASPDTLIVLDVRDAQAYQAGHVAGAFRVALSEWTAASLAAKTGLEHKAQWRTRIGDLGVSGREPVVIYDGGNMTGAARLWFIFQLFGVEDAGVLNGGYPALEPLLADGRLAMSREPSTRRPTTFHPSGATENRVAVVERQQVREAVKEGQAQIFDARTQGEYTGAMQGRNPRGGHIPTAINLSHKELLDAQGRLKSPEQLAQLLEQAGFKRGQPMITHCQSGGRASLAALAAERAGYGPVMNYYLSFGDWAADASCPLETGE